MSEIKGQAPVMHQKDLIIEKCEEIKLVEQIEDEYLGKVQLYRLHPYVKYVASKTIPFQFIPNFSQRIQMRNPNIFFYIKKAHANQKATQDQTFNVFFEYNYASLEQMIQKRKDNGWHYPEIELWTIIKEVSAGLKFLMDQKIHHGELNKASIFFDDEYLLYRVYDNQLLNADKYYIYQVKKQSLLIDTGTLPPEFSSYDLIKYQNPYKLDVWNFALIILECATLSNVKELLYTNNTLKTDQLHILLQSLNGKYSVAFINLLLKMIDADPRTRLDWAQILKITQSEPLASQAPPYQVEPTQLHPSRSLNNLHEIVVGAQPTCSAQKENLNQDLLQGGIKKTSPLKQPMSDLQIYNTQNQQKLNLTNTTSVTQPSQIGSGGYSQQHYSANNIDSRGDYENMISKLDSALTFKSQFSAQQLSSTNLLSQPPKRTNSLQPNSQGVNNDGEKDKSALTSDFNNDGTEQNIEIRQNILKNMGYKASENNPGDSSSITKPVNSTVSSNSTSSGPTSNQAVNQRLMLLNKKIQDTLMLSQKQTKKLTQNGPR